jgi:hypothetical protein
MRSCAISGQSIRDFLQTRVIDGARTRDPKDHNLVLYQLSYDHHEIDLRGYPLISLGEV